MSQKPAIEELVKRVTDLSRKTAEQKRLLESLERLNALNQDLLGTESLTEKLKRLTDGVVEIFNAQFARIWIIKPGDLCDSGCYHATVTEEPHVCHDRDRCLHLLSSSGYYTHIDGNVHRRVPYGFYNIGDIAAGEAPKFVSRNVTQDPRIRDHNWARALGLVSFAGFRLLSSDGNVIGVLALFSKYPITPEEEALLDSVANTTAQVIQTTVYEEALRENEEKYRILFENSKDSSYITTRGGEIVEANQSLLDLFGYTWAEIFEWNAQSTYVSPDDRSGFKKEIEENGFVKDFEAKLRKKDGTEFDCLVTASVRLSREGSIVGYQGIIRDVTELKRSEEALRESEQKYRIVLESNPDPVVVYDTVGKMLYLNPAFTRVFGWSFKERFGKKLDEFVPDEAWPETKMMIDKVLAGEAFSGIETHRYTKEGRLIPVSISGATYQDSEGNHVGTVVNLRDISEQKRIEAQLQQAQKLEAIGILSGGLAHDFNNLLAIIMGNIDLAKDDIKPEVGVSENLAEAEKASLRAKELNKQLLTFSKGGEPVKEVGSIGDLIKDTTNLTISGSDARCEFSLPENLWLAEFDEGQMKHAIKNLIDNAIEAMPDGGSINVVAENVEIDLETKAPDLPLSKGKYIKIAIKDKGIGIPKDHLSKIFDPYFSTKEMGVQKGMGMGLAMTYSIINRHEGHITVESELGAGTTFTIYLPVAVEEIVGIETVKMIEPEKPAVLTGRILVMDDEEMIRKLATKVLRRLGYEPELAQDGAEAIELYKRAMDSAKPFDAVILDLTVKGGMGGKDAVKELLEINPRVKAIVSSGYSKDPEMTDFRKYGFVGALPKPYAMKDLKDVLNKVIKE